MKKPTRTSKKKSSLWESLHARATGRRHRLAADVTREDDWDNVDVPRIRMSRAIAVMIGLHLIAVAGLFVFHLVGGKDSSQPEIAAADSNSTPAETTDASVPGSDVDAIAAGDSAPMDETLVGSPPPSIPGDVADDRAGEVATITGAASGGEATSAAESLTVAAQSKPRYYRVQQDDQPQTIAGRFGITVTDLTRANPGATYRPETDIVIPSLRQVIAPVSHETQKDSVNTVLPASGDQPVVRNRFALNEPALTERAMEDSPVDTGAKEVPAEPVKPAAPAVRDTPVVTEKKKPATTEKPVKPVARTTEKPKPTPAPAPAARSVTVGKGDTIYKIARKMGVTPEALMRANGISDPSRLRAGQVLKAPAR